MQRLRGFKNVLLTGVLTLGFAAAGIAAQETGKVEVVALKGRATATSAEGGATTTLKKGSIITQGTQVTTSGNSTATLLFSNGSTIVLEPDSVFSIDRYTIEPFDPQSVAYKDLTKEPSVSNTKVSIRKGALAGNMRKLNPESKFEFMTPVGPAGIRGTKVFISVAADRQNPGSFIVTIAASEGRVVFTPTGGTAVSVAAGQYTQYRAVPVTDPANPTVVTGYRLEAITTRNGALAAVPVSEAAPAVQSLIATGADEATDSVNSIPTSPFTTVVDVADDAGGGIGTPAGGVIQGGSPFGTGGSGGGGGTGDQGAIDIGAPPTPTPAPGASTPTPTPVPPAS